MEQETIGNSVTIREAAEPDVPVLAALHVKTWTETYQFHPNPPTAELREYQWRQMFKSADGSWFCLVVEDSKGQLIGFAKGQAYAHEDLPDFNGELNKIYLLREYQGKGIGKRLIGEVARRLFNMGILNMVVFGNAEHPSCKFYEAVGGDRLYAPNGEFHGGYCWKDIRLLLTNC